MKRLYLPLLVLLAIASIAATIKLYTDYPNTSAPVSTDFLLFQRGGSYVNSAQSQYLPTWFNNPVFTGNGSINGGFNVGGSLTVGGAVITGVTYYGDGSGLSNVASQVYLKNLNDFGTNETFLNTTFNGVSIFDQINANLFYPTNLFTGLTNVQALGTDANGLLVVGSSTITNVTITNAFIQNLTNNTFVNTNIFISTSNAYFSNNVFISTNFSTNLYFVSGKGNTLVITNVFVAQPGSLVNSNTANNSAVVTDGTHAYTNAVNAHGVFTNSSTGPPLFGLLQATEIAPGISPTFNLVNSTNLIYRYTTNAVTALTLTFGQSFFTNVSSANITISAVNAQDLAALETCILYCTNSSGSDHTVTLPVGIGGPGLGAPPVITVTNKQSCRIYIEHYGNQETNCWFIPRY